MKNIEFSYMYRDGGNYKKHGEVVFSNPDGLSIETIDGVLKSAFDAEEFFIASQIKIPEVFIWQTEHKYDEDSDHSWHEYDGVDESADLPTDTRTISEFIVDVAAARKSGWKEFDPKLRIAS